METWSWGCPETLPSNTKLNCALCLVMAAAMNAAYGVKNAGLKRTSILTTWFVFDFFLFFVVFWRLDEVDWDFLYFAMEQKNRLVMSSRHTYHELTLISWVIGRNILLLITFVWLKNFVFNFLIELFFWSTHTHKHFFIMVWSQHLFVLSFSWIISWVLVLNTGAFRPRDFMLLATCRACC